MTVELLFIYKRLALWQKSLCVFRRLFTGEPISLTFQYYVQDWGSGSDLSVSSDLLGYDAVLLGKQFPDFKKGNSAIFFKAWRGSGGTVF